MFIYVIVILYATIHFHAMRTNNPAHIETKIVIDLKFFLFI